MHSHAIHARGRFGDEECDRLRAFWRAMAGAAGGAAEGARHGHHRGWGYGPWMRHAFGGMPPRGPIGGRMRKARRGDVRTAALLLLSEEPRNGYQIMQELEQRSGGVWSPSPGSVYPALQQLEDEGLIKSAERDGRKVFELTDSGRAHLEERGADARPPWEQMTSDFSDVAVELGTIFREAASAFAQVMRTGSEAQMSQAREELAKARRELYRILADGGDGGSRASDAGKDDRR